MTYGKFTVIYFYTEKVRTMSLTKKQKQIYDYIKDYLNEYGFAPTQMEIKEHFGFKSLGSVQDYIRYLTKGGYLEKSDNSVRGLRPTTPNDSLVVEIPLLGAVAAGSPIEAMEGNEMVSIPQAMVPRGECFALTVSGNSMIEDGILDGDIILVKKTNSAFNGETVVATIDGEATVKRFYKKKEQIELHPANSTMQPIIVTEGAFEIKGSLVGLFRSY